MSETTTINSKAMQALLARSETQAGPTGKGGGATFHQVLEGALSEKPQAATQAGTQSATQASPLTLTQPAAPTAGSTKPVLTMSRATLAGAPAKLTKALAASTTTRRTDPTKQLGGRDLKLAASAGADDGPDSGPAASPTAGTKPDAKPAATSSDASAGLDSTQLKVVNAPAMPTPPPPAAHEAQPASARGQSAPSTKATPSLNAQPTAATGPSSAMAAAPRGFAAVLASAHTSAALPPALVDQASFDPTLHISVTPGSAHLSMDTGATGPLIAQLQITNGVADVHLTGDAASLLARHGAELSLGLTAAGLQPGRLEISAPAAAADLQSATSDGSASGGFRGDAQSNEESDSNPREHGVHQPRPDAASTLSRRVSRVHVKA